MKIGKVSENILKRSVLRQIHTKREEIVSGAGIGEDCAIFALSEDETMVTCVQETAVSLPGEHADEEDCKKIPRSPVRNLIYRSVNNIVACGAEPVGVLISLLLPVRTEEPEIKVLMAEAESVCGELSLQIAGGQTRVSAGVNVPFMGITGYGKADKGTCRTAKAAKPGQDIVMSKWIGLEGTAYLAKEYRDKLLERYPAYLVEEAEGFDRYLSVIPEAKIAIKAGVNAMHDASEGGILASLWELAEGSGVGMTIELKKLPLRQETVEVCECLGCNPYELLAGGCLIMTCEDGQSLVEALEAENIPAVIVGRTTDSKERIIVNEDEIRYLDRPKQDEIYRERN